MSVLKRLCPHGLWSYNTHRRRRWCRICAQQQRWNEETERWEDVYALDA